MSVEKIGRYEIIQELGQGSMATVYLGRDSLIKRQVAIKVMSPDLTDKTFEGRFKYEAELIAILDHPYIVPIFDFGTENNQMYIVMRYMSGGTLMDRIRYEEIPMPEIVPIIERIANVLDTIHGRGIIHRDLKPGNILFNERGEAFLGDFGVAKNIVQPGGFTATDMILGTIDYMSPEQIQGGKDLDGRTDVYALGIMIFYILTGLLPFQRDTLVGTAMAHLSDPIPSVEHQLPEKHSAWDEVFQKALSKEKEGRYKTAGELVEDVTALVNRLYSGSN
ncbi:MAG: serine/threonine-protein kinase [Chloroflexota bacterium]